MELVYQNIKKIAVVALVILIIAVVSFISGRYSVRVKETVQVEYLPQETIRDSVIKLVPVAEKRTIDSISIAEHMVRSGLVKPIIKDSIIYIKVDTQKIFEDWSTIRSYNKTLFDSPTLGKLTLNQQLQYNRIQKLDYEFIPIQQVVTEIKEKKYHFDLHGGIGMFNNNSAAVQVGLIHRSNFGIGYQYQRNFDLNQNSHGLFVLYRIRW